MVPNTSGMRTAPTAAALALLLLGAGVAGAHGWGVTVDDQVVGDGTLLVGHASLLEGGYLAVHVEDGDEPGRAVGHVRLDHGEHAGVEIGIDDEYWTDVDGGTHLLVAAHEADGDGEFTWPDGDPLYRPDDDLVVDHVAVRKADGTSARVLAARQESDGAVTLRRVDLPQDGFVVLFEDADGERGEVVGVRRLPAGRHENVTVEVDPRFYNEVRARLYLVAGVHVDDGDGTWNADSDEPVLVDDEPVTTSFDARKTRASVPTPEPTPTSSPTRTATATATPSAAATPTAPSTSSPAADSSTADDGQSPTPTPPVGGVPGFGPSVALVALAVAGLVAARS